jgi:hypothetical protein
MDRKKKEGTEEKTNVILLLCMQAGLQVLTPLSMNLI